MSVKLDRLKLHATRLAIIALAAVLLGAVVALMTHVQTLLSSDSKINLTEIVTQNKDVITSKIGLEVNNLETAANQLADIASSHTAESDPLTASFEEYCGRENGESMSVANTDGTALFSDGALLDISGRGYFKLALEGTPNISGRVISRITGDEMFVISVPVYSQDQIIGTLQKQYTPEEMYDICSLSLFSSQGSMSIINSDGYIVISSQGGDYSQETENYYRALYARGNQDAAKQLEGDIGNGTAGFMETRENGEVRFSAYTPIETIHDWYLITSVSTTAVSPNAAVVVQLFYVILFLVVAVFAICMLLFLSYKRRQQKNLERVAFVDPVTGGSTFSRFGLDVKEAIEKNDGRQCSLVAFDIDNFKYINSYYGFDFGDRVLRTMHDAVKENLQPGEALARVSGDHFIALVFDADDARLESILACATAQKDATIYVSAGVYDVPDPPETVNLMADKASTAALGAKSTLHRRIEHYSREHDERLARNEQMKRAVERALEQNEFVAFYQPKVNVETNSLVGAEALVRWRKEDGSLVPPLEFISMCEKTGLVIELDMAVLEKVLRFLKKNLDDGIECVPVSVNFSRLHLLDDGFIDRVADTIRRYGVPARLIEMELTESAMFDSQEAIASFVESVHEKGLCIAMDDFGSGYSSLNMLKDIPIDVLKIDQGFLRNTEDSDRLAVIFASVAQMAQNLDIDVVVEGVETADNVDLMKRNGCFVAQGYFYARPMSEDEFEPILRKGTL